MGKKIERRKDRRYQLKKNTCACLGNEKPIMGQIINISMGGIAFSYIFNKKSDQRSYSFINIGEDEFFLKDLPFKSVHDLSLSTPDPYSSVEIRMRSGKFENLTDIQMDNLLFFIQQNASVVNGRLA